MANEFVARNGLIAQDNSTISGSLTVTNGITGAITGTASYASNANLLDGLDSSVFTSTGSFNAYTSSNNATVTSVAASTALALASIATLTSRTGSYTLTSSFNSYTASNDATVSCVSSVATSALVGVAALAARTGSYATTGSNNFNGTQTITGSLLQSGNYTTTGTITAQTINVQQVTSSIVYSCGSNNFGTAIGNTQVFTGSMFITGSNITANVSNTCFSGQVCSNTVSTTDGTNVSTLANNYLRYNGGDFYVDACAVGGNFRIRTSNASALDSTALFICGKNSNVGIGTTTPSYKLDVNGSFSFTTGGNYLQYNSGILYHGNYYQYPSGNDYLLFARTSGGLNFGTNDAQRLLISSTGIACFACQVCAPAFVGGTVSGTTGTFTGTVIAGNGSSQTEIRINSSGGNNEGPFLRLQKGGANIAYVGAYSSIVSGTSNDLTYYAVCSQQWMTNNSTATKMLLNASGNLGLGVTPSAWVDYKVLQFGGGSISSYTDNLFIEVNQNAFWNGSSYVYVNNGFASRYQQNVGRHEWYQAPTGTASNAISFTQAMTLDASGRLAVGNTSVSALNERLNITGNGIAIEASDAGSTMLLGNFGSSDGIVGMFTNDNLQIRTNNTARFIIGNDGNIAMGNFSPSGTPPGDYRSFEIGRQGNTIAGAPWKSNLYLSTNATITAGSTAFTYRNSSVPATFLSLEGGELSFANAASGTVGCTITFCERMRITSGGFVGIGTPSPTQKLSVYDGAIAIQSSAAGGAEVYRFGIGTTTQMTMTLEGGLAFRYGRVATNDYGQFTIRDGYTNDYPAYSFNNDTNTGISNAFGTADTLNFITGGSERMRITSCGLVGIGTTNPQGLLHVYCLGYDGQIRITDSAVTGADWSLLPSSGGDNPIFRLYNRTSAVTNMTWTCDGRVVIGGTIASNVGLTIYGSNAATIYQTPNTGTGATNGFYVGHTGDVSYVWNYNNYPTVLATNNTERIRITSTGIACFACQVCAPRYVTSPTTISNNNAVFGAEVNGGYRYFQGTLANGEKFGSQGGTYIQGFYFISWYDGASVRGYAIFATVQPTANAGTALISSGGGTYAVSATYNASNAISFAFDGSGRGAVLSNNTGVGLTFYAYVFGGV